MTWLLQPVLVAGGADEPTVVSLCSTLRQSLPLSVLKLLESGPIASVFADGAAFIADALLADRADLLALIIEPRECWMYVYMFVCMYVCMHVCTYVCTCVPPVRYVLSIVHAYARVYGENIK